MSHNRLDYLNNNRIIYRRYPVNDKPTHDFVWGWFYEQGTHEYYYLFHSASMITTYRSLKWHMLVLSYLNTEMTNDNFKKLYKYITNRDNGFTTFSINNNDSSRIFKEILNSDFERAPKNKARKVIFKMGCGLTKTEKLKITGSLIGRKNSVTSSDLYEIMLYIHDTSEKITIKKIATILKVSTRTIFRNMNNQLNKEKKLLNEELQRTKLRTLQKEFSGT
jgi:hypothetical protein|tara:strand:- start:2708 stop:3370 length:663 start_codon:yes stop_codon:yes gene_type:complete